MEDNLSITHCLAGDTEAYGEVVARYQAHLLSLAWNIIGNQDDARDIVQEVFIKSYGALPNFDRTRNLKPWLVIITIRRCRDWLRRKRSFLNYFRQQANNMDNFLAHPAPQKMPGDSIQYSRMLDRCSEKERIAIVLRINEEYSAREIAAVLHCSESTARVHLLNARRKLKEAIGELSYQEELAEYRSEES